MEQRKFRLQIKHLSVLLLVSAIIACGGATFIWSSIIEREFTSYAQIELSTDNELIVSYKTYQNNLVMLTFDTDGKETYRSEQPVGNSNSALWLDKHQVIMRNSNNTRPPYLLDFDEGILWEVDIFPGQLDIQSIQPTEGSSDYIAFSGNYTEIINDVENSGAFLALVDRDGNNLWNMTYPGYSKTDIFKKNQLGWIALLKTNDDTYIAIQLDNNYQEIHTTTFPKTGYIKAVVEKGVIITERVNDSHITHLYNWSGDNLATLPFSISAAENGMLYKILDHSSITRFDWNGNTLWQSDFTRIGTTWAEISGVTTEGVPYVSYTTDSITGVTTTGYRHTSTTKHLTFNADTGKMATIQLPSANTVTTCPDQTYYCDTIISEKEGYVWPLDVESVNGSVISLDYYGGHLPYPEHKKIALTRIK